ncbi:MAG: AraC family transcriptional regulator [Pseudomonadota bacterium]
MQVETFRLDRYLSAGDASHVARKDLAPRWPTKAHDHDYFELFLIERGETDHWINGRRQRLKRGSLTFIRAHDAHAFRADAQMGCRIFNVMFRKETVHHLNARYPNEFSSRFFDGKDDQPDRHDLRASQFEHVTQLADRLINSSLSLAQAEEFLLSLANQVLTPALVEPTRMPSWLSDACNALQSPAVFVKGTSGFVEVAGRSHEHLCRSCKEFLGTTPSAYVNRIRANYAAEKLVRTQSPIADISSEVGIDNIGHFYRVFRDHFRTTPRAYRLANQKNPFE